MAKILFANNASSLLTTGMNSSDSTLTITAGSESLFPIITTVGDYFMVTIVDIDGDYEIVRVTATSNNTFTIERAQEGTTARAFAIDSIVENRLTAESLENVLNSLPVATETVAGVAAIATEAETIEGTNDTDFVTPLKLQSKAVTVIDKENPSDKKFVTEVAVAGFSAGGAGKVLGEIFQAILPYGVYPEGAVRTTGATYTQGLFPDVYQALVDNKVLNVTMEEFTDQVAEFGRCLAFGLDTTAKTFRIPLLKDGDSITVAMSELEHGKNYSAGVPNINGSVAFFNAGVVKASVTGAFKADESSNSRPSASTTDSRAGGAGILDASLVSPIYNNNVTTVLTEQARAPYFVQIANAGENASLIDWTEFMSALDQKADKADLGDYVIDYYPKTEAEKLEANGSWWRKFKSGWIEQGGIASHNVPVIFKVPFSNTNYTYTTGLGFYSSNAGTMGVSLLSAASKTPTQINFMFRWNGNSTNIVDSIYWEAKGY